VEDRVMMCNINSGFMKEKNTAYWGDISMMHSFIPLGIDFYADGLCLA